MSVNLSTSSSVRQILWQPIIEMDPGQSILRPGMVRGYDHSGLIQAGHRYGHVISTRFSLKGKRRPTLGTKAPEPTCPLQRLGVTGCESEVSAAERCPSHKSRAAAPSAVLAMTVSNVARAPCGFVPGLSTEASTSEFEYGIFHTQRYRSALLANVPRCYRASASPFRHQRRDQPHREFTALPPFLQ